MPLVDVIENILITVNTSPSNQIIPNLDDPYMRVLRAYNAPCPETIEPAPTSSLPVQPIPTPADDTTTTTQSTPPHPTPATHRTTRIRIPVHYFKYSDLPAASPKRSNSIYRDTSTTPQSVSPASSPDRSPLRQRLKRTDDSYLEDEEEESEREPEEESEPEGDPEEEPLPIDIVPECTCGQREGKQVLEEVQGAFEIGQTSRDAQIREDDPEAPIGLSMRVATLGAREEHEDMRRRIEETDGMVWKDIGDVSGDDIPDSPTPDIPDDISTPNSPDYNVNAHDSVWTILYQHASLLDTHTDQLKGLQPSRFEQYDRNLDTLFRRADAERREVFDLGMKIDEMHDIFSHKLRDLDSRVRGLDRSQTRNYGMLRRARVTDRAQLQGSMTAEYMIGVVMRENEALRHRVDHLEAAIGGMTAAFERLRLERDRE